MPTPASPRVLGSAATLVVRFNTVEVTGRFSDPPKRYSVPGPFGGSRKPPKANEEPILLFK